MPESLLDQLVELSLAVTTLSDWFTFLADYHFYQAAMTTAMLELIPQPTPEQALSDNKLIIEGWRFVTLAAMVDLVADYINIEIEKLRIQEAASTATTSSSDQSESQTQNTSSSFSTNLTSNKVSGISYIGWQEETTFPTVRIVRQGKGRRFAQMKKSCITKSYDT